MRALTSNEMTVVSGGLVGTNNPNWLQTNGQSSNISQAITNARELCDRLGLDNDRKLSISVSSSKDYSFDVGVATGSDNKKSTVTTQVTCGELKKPKSTDD